MKEREEKPIKKFLKDYEQKFVLAISHNFFLILSIIAGACLTVGIILFLLGVIPVPDISRIYRTLSKPRSPQEKSLEKLKISEKQITKELEKGAKDYGVLLKLLTDSLISYFPEDSYRWEDMVKIIVKKTEFGSFKVKRTIHGVEYYLTGILKKFNKEPVEKRVYLLSDLITQISSASGEERFEKLKEYYARLYEKPKKKVPPKREKKEKKAKPKKKREKEVPVVVRKSLLADSLEAYVKKLGEYFPSPYYNWRTYDDTLIIENEFGLKTKKIVHHKGLDLYIDTLLVYMKHDTSLVIKELNKLLAKISQIKLEERKDYYIQFIKEHHPDFVAYKEALSNLLDSFKGDDRETARKTLEKLVVEGKNLRELTRVFHTIRSIIREVPEKERLMVLHFCLEDWKTTGRIGYTNDVEIDGRIYLIRTLCISPCIWNPSPEGLYSYTLSGVKGLKHSILEFVHDNRFTSRSRNYQLKLLEEIYDMLKELPPEQRKIAFNTFYSLWKTKYDSLRHLNELSERRYEERLQEVIAQTQKLSSSIRSFNRKKWEIAKFFITKVVPISFIIIILLSLYIVIYAIERNTRTVQELRNALEKLNTSIQGNEKEKNSENNTQ